MRNFIVARSWRTFGKQQLVALNEICRLIAFHRSEMQKVEIHLNINNPNPEMQEIAYKIIPKDVDLYFYTNEDLESYVRKYEIEPDLNKFHTWEWIYHIILYHKLYTEKAVDYILTYDDDIIFNAFEYKDIVHFVCSKIPFTIADQYADADKPMMGKLVEKFGNDLFENYYRCFGNNKSGNSGFMGFNNSTMKLFESKEDFEWLLNSFTYRKWDHLTMQGVPWDGYKVLLQEQSLLSVLNRAYSNNQHILLLPRDGYILSQDLEKMKMSKVMHFISTTKYGEYYLKLIDDKYNILKQIYVF